MLFLRHYKWSFHDYGSDYEFAWPVQNSGVVDACRISKYTYHYLSAHWQKAPQIYIAGHWTFPGDETKEKPIVVISNCETVELYLNGSLLGKKSRCSSSKKKMKTAITKDNGTLSEHNPFIKAKKNKSVCIHFSLFLSTIAGLHSGN